MPPVTSQSDAVSQFAAPRMPCDGGDEGFASAFATPFASRPCSALGWYCELKRTKRPAITMNGIEPRSGAYGGRSRLAAMFCWVFVTVSSGG